MNGDKDDGHTAPKVVTDGILPNCRIDTYWYGYQQCYDQGEDARTTILLENLAAYTSVLRNHIHKEDHSFYPLVDKEFSEAEQQSLLKEFHKEESKAGGQIFEESQKLVMEMGALL